MYKTVVIIFLSVVASSVCSAQITLDKVKKKVEKKVENTIEKNIDKGIDKTLDKAEDAVSSGNEESDSDTKVKTTEKNSKINTAIQSKDKSKDESADGTNADTIPQSQTGKVEWNKYDFIPGDVIIFEDDLAGEQNGEFPSKWDLTKGTIENAVLDGENVIYFIECNTNGGGGIVPLLKNSKEDYLPEEFTIEFEAYFERPNNQYTLYLVDYKNQLKLDKETKAGDKWLRFEQNSVDGKNITSNWYPGTSGKDTKPNPGWRRIAVSFNTRAIKAYIDDSRIINIPNLGYNPTGITLGYHNPGGNRKGYVKNIRIAKGAVPLYDKMMTDGKIVTTGIRFDVNKSSIKPESMGVINSIVALMNDKPELNFSVEGHTDSDGDDKSNQTLSEARAKSVMNKLIEMGINASRLKSKGFGELKPVADNGTPEGKANNRRVEFVKF